MIITNKCEKELLLNILILNLKFSLSNQSKFNISIFSNIHKYFFTFFIFLATIWQAQYNTNEADKLIFENEQHQDEKFYQSVMNIITKANEEKFEEVTVVCEALEEIYLKVHGERLKREQQEAVDKAVAEKDAYIKKLESQLGIITT